MRRGVLRDQWNHNAEKGSKFRLEARWSDNIGGGIAILFLDPVCSRSGTEG